MSFHNKYHKIPFFFHVIITYFAERQIPSAGMVKKNTFWLTANEAPLWLLLFTETRI